MKNAFESLPRNVLPESLSFANCPTINHLPQFPDYGMKCDFVDVMPKDYNVVDVTNLRTDKVA